MSLCRADKFLLAGGAITLGSAALLGPSAFSIGVPVAAMAALMTDGIFRPASSLLYPTMIRGRSDRSQVALTFDDGPHPEITPAVLDILAAHQARGTFFIIGRHLEKHRTLGERMVAEGHEIGNHSWEHSYFQNFYPASRYSLDIERCSQLIRSITRSTAEPLFRPPVGLKSPGMSRAAHAKKLVLAAWSLHSRDTFARDANKVVDRVLSSVRAGDIVLMHDGHEREGAQRRQILEILPRVLKGLKERGLSPVTVSELTTGTQPAKSAPNGATLAADDGRN